MKKYVLLRTNIMICIIIVLGFLGIVITNNISYKKILVDDIQNISKLTSSTIYAEIDNELTKPIFVSQTMANDTFLKRWLKEEKKNGEDISHSKELQKYLLAFKEKYKYDSVFLVSAKSDLYYYYEGINKEVSRDDEHDIWYYNFLDSNKYYELDVDTDQANNNELTVFVNCRIEDENGSLMGVVGVGVKMSCLQETLKKYESEFNLQSYLVNKDGLVQIHSDTRKIEKVNIFDNSSLDKLKGEILDNKKTMETHWYPNGELDNCLITHYIDNLNWYLIVEKDTSKIQESFSDQLKNDFVIIGVILILLILLSTFIINRYNKIVMKMATTDEITGIKNGKAFNNLFYKELKKYHQRETTLFMFDIDSFKKVNDEEGHIFGNKVLINVGKISEKILKEQGVIARWGGDEFIGLIHGNLETSEKLLLEIMKELSLGKEIDNYKVTISGGIVEINYAESLEELTNKADQALYNSKQNGRNRITKYSEIKLKK